ncbi:MAG: hypothetical protein FWF90_16175 [Promicromonosporaceae bacterium]|nr:hypothetical protein [Promicromonosporaceae bacterium]
MPRLEVGVKRRVIFQAYCRRLLCDWHGPERDYRSDAEFDRACHELDKHGGASTRREEADHAAP